MNERRYLQIPVTQDERSEIIKALQLENFATISAYVRKIVLDRARKTIRDNKES